MSDLYSYKGAYPYPLPKDMSHYDIKDFVLAPPTPEISPGKKLGWDGSNWFVRDANEAEISIQWAAVRKQRDSLLSLSDVFVVRAYENGEPVPTETIEYRKALRDITSQTNPFAIIWPTQPEKPY